VIDGVRSRVATVPIRMLDRIPVVSRDWMTRRGKDVVFLNAMAGVTQEGSSKTYVTAAPRAKERALPYYTPI
jgi:hypothetical protein